MITLSYYLLYKVNLVAELKGHNDPIMALTEHPEHNWVI